jgi:hypothetical protein
MGPISSSDHPTPAVSPLGEEAAAWQRARTLADFYGRPVEVCVVAGPVVKSIGEPVEPGPLAPQPTFNER